MFFTKSTMKMKSNVIILLLFISASQHGFAQMHMEAQGDSAMKMDEDSMKMAANFSLNLPMNRDGSGTSWQPDQSPMMMYMKMIGRTAVMLHGAFFLRYNQQDLYNGSNGRGGNKTDAPNMMMFMVTHKISPKNLLSFHSMFSFDPITVGLNGYPLLFQSGESYHGIPLVDRQHPHDLIAELAVAYTHSFDKNIDLTGYFGYPGEPAVGPSVFMHRLSAMNDPDAPIGHHWQDATHITFGVGTLGFRYKIVKAEGSIFTGREPDENRFNFDQARFDSYSYRVSANPNPYWSMQFSQGFIHSPELLEPDVNVVRTTGSVMHTKLLKHGRFIATSLVYGLNKSSSGEMLNSVLLESNLKLTPVSIYMRYEYVQKDGHELLLSQFSGNHVYNINALTLGLNKVVLTQLKTDLSLGIQGTMNFPDAGLQPVYGRTPLSAEVYLKMAPSLGHHHH